MSADAMRRGAAKTGGSAQNYGPALEQRAKIAGVAPVNAVLPGEPAEKLLHLGGAAEEIVSGGRAAGHLRVVRITDEDADAVAAEGFEGVLVGDVVAEVERHDVGAIEAEGVEEIADGLALVPVDLRLHLVDPL